MFRTIIRDIPNRINFLFGKYTVEIGYPWFSYGAIIAIEELVKRDHKVLELGSGGSTIFFSRRCNSVKSYETKPEWEKKVMSALPNSSNVTMICGYGEPLLESLRKEPNEYYDWLIVDLAHSKGRMATKTRNRFRLRYLTMLEGIPKLKTGGYMVVDNYAEDNLNTFDYTGWDVYTFDDLRYSGRGTKICIKGRSQ